MPKYKALLKGEGFPVVSETGETELLGFYATRWVKAENEEQAELAAVQLIKSDESLHELLDARIESNPMIYLEALGKVPWWRKLGGKGYSFYPMEEKPT